MAEHTLDSLERGLAVAELVATRDRVSLAEVMGLLGVSKATAYRILVTLESRGWVARDPGATGYRVGPVLMHLFGTDPIERLRVVSDGPLRELVQHTGETANLAVLVGDHLVYEKVIDGHRSLRMYVEPGSVAPFHATGLGRAFLAACSDDTVARLLGDGPFEAVTDKTLTSRAAIMASIDDTRRRGYGVDAGEAEIGATCVAAAVLGADGAPVAAVSISGPDSRYSALQIATAASLVRRAADDIARSLRAPHESVVDNIGGVRDAD